MDAHQRDQFLAQPRTAVLATVDPRGRPHAVPVWFRHADGAFRIITDRGSAKHRNVERSGRAALTETILSEFDRFTADQGVARSGEGALRSYVGPSGAGRLHWRRGGDALPQTLAHDTLLSEVALTESERDVLRQRGSYWLDLAGRTRSREGSPVTEELAAFLGRYGIRLPRA